MVYVFEAFGMGSTSGDCCVLFMTDTAWHPAFILRCLYITRSVAPCTGQHATVATHRTTSRSNQVRVAIGPSNIWREQWLGLPDQARKY